MPLRHRALKMCEYHAESTSELDDEMLLFRLRELVQPKFVRTEERVAMGTHDFPPLEVSKRLTHFVRQHFVCRMLTIRLIERSLPS